MSKIDDIILEAIDDWAAQGRSDEQIHGVRNFFCGRGGRLPQQLKGLMLELIASFEVVSLPSDSPELRYWQGFADAQLQISKKVEDL